MSNTITIELFNLITSWKQVPHILAKKGIREIPEEISTMFKVTNNKVILKYVIAGNEKKLIKRGAGEKRGNAIAL